MNWGKETFPRAHITERRQKKDKNCTVEDHQLSIAVENLAQQELIFPAADGIQLIELPSYLCLSVCLFVSKTDAPDFNSYWRRYAYPLSYRLSVSLLDTSVRTAALKMGEISKATNLVDSSMFTKALLSTALRHLLLVCRQAARRTWRERGHGNADIRVGILRRDHRPKRVS